ncbi:hypothetical protein Nepgr_017251 [Nepenthes gracilis]|uniref:Uncharacterized protein n=1 Tax=Nepenthes gracilis TaxID=150966 RepID=A0AAD3SP40_NEPGR|nr:hypothetical protein Nepgr_017251 [Nepenthes gracilis]
MASADDILDAVVTDSTVCGDGQIIRLSYPCFPMGIAPLSVVTRRPKVYVNKAPNVNVVRFDPEALSAEAPSSASHCWKMAPCSDISHPVVNCSSKLAPVVAEKVLVDAGPKMAHCPFGNDRVKEENVPLVNMPMINHCPQGGLGEDGMSPVPRGILDPTPSVLSMNLQLDDRHPADAESIESLASFSSPSPHTAPAD